MIELTRQEVAKYLSLAATAPPGKPLVVATDTPSFKLVCKCGGEPSIILDYRIYAELSIYICCPRCLRGVHVC